MKISKNYKMVETQEAQGNYGFWAEYMIVEGEDGSRLLLTEEWGGNSIEGECYRYKHGCVYKIKNDDNFGSLGQNSDHWDFGEPLTILEAMEQQLDTPDREVLFWDGAIIDRIASAARKKAA